MTIVGSAECEIEVRENWGLRVVVMDNNGMEKVVWGQELRRCSSNPHARDSPYDASKHHKWNRQKLRKLNEGKTVEYPSAKEYVKARVIRVVRGGCWQNVRYTVPVWRCLHQHSVKVTKRMIERARRDSRIWGSGLRAPPLALTERHIVTPETFNHLRGWIFSTDFLEPLKASEQSTQRGHCFAVKEAATATFLRYQQSAYKKKVDPVSERVYRSIPDPMHPCTHSHTPIQP